MKPPHGNGRVNMSDRCSRLLQLYIYFFREIIVAVVLELCIVWITGFFRIPTLNFAGDELGSPCFGYPQYSQFSKKKQKALILVHSLSTGAT